MQRFKPQSEIVAGRCVRSPGIGKTEHVEAVCFTVCITRHRVREGIELRSKQDRAINERLSLGVRPTSDALLVYHNEHRMASVGLRAAIC
ncbi:hypothetical protein DPMN_028613 [Dreissena polymorpha]|uniref:Uncharacterized protein n=1 Tax=Dreissena polymorpha TaxID=45954 RepID=A0A9D4LXL7_DREPO|nr:hypothetical protein DPMN_028613 [Dreissena polymorpha]